MKTLNFKLHTIILLIGPSNCGKSFFAEKYLQPTLRRAMKKLEPANTADPIYDRQSVKIISSDAIRRDLLDQDLCKYDKQMMQVSGQAFDLLFARLEAYTSYPVNAHFVIVDTTGLSEHFRDKVIDIAKKNNYNLDAIVFDYKNRDDYFKLFDEEQGGKHIVRDHIRRLRETHKTLTKKKYNQIIKIDSPDFTHEELNIDDAEQYFQHLLPSRHTDGRYIDYIIVGDIHGCIDEFKALICQCGVEIDQNNKILDNDDDSAIKRFVLIGDLIDKGYDTPKVIDFVYDNRDWFELVMGNHENYVFKYLNGKLKDKNTETIKDKFFQSADQIKQSKQTLDKFNELCKHAKDFLISRDFIATHAPCEAKHLGKLDSKSKRSQRIFRYSRRRNFDTKKQHEKAVEKELSFLQHEAVRNQPYHIFGHVAVKRAIRVKNKVGIDTGCVGGNKLTAVRNLHAGRPEFIHVEASNEKINNEELLDIFKPEKQIDLKSLEINETKRIGFIAWNKINFVSGTMCPADKDEESNDLESLDQALNYYKNKGVTKVLLQPKYMGSRCNVYLHKNIEKCYAVSRNGYIINHVDLLPLFVDLHKKYKSKYFDNGIQLMVIDGELMPWHALGKGMIENLFHGMAHGVESEADFLTDHGFNDALNEAMQDYETSGFLDDVRNETGKKKLIKKYGHARYSTLKNLHEIKNGVYSQDQHREACKRYKKQLELYGRPGEIHYKPFALLKIIDNEGKEQTFFDETNKFVYTAVTDDQFVELDLTNEDSKHHAEQFYLSITTNQQMEGVVIKPEKVYTPKVAPYLKVRNKEYLTLVYGYDYLFPSKYNKLLKRKRINNKLRVSISEFELGKRMLETPYDEITPDNSDYKQLVAKMVLEQRKEKEIDPRL